jgi:hypothetical protein
MCEIESIMKSNVMMQVKKNNLMEGVKVKMWKGFHHHFTFPNNQLPWICQLSHKSKLGKCFILLCFGCSNFHLKVTICMLICMLKSDRS